MHLVGVVDEAQLAQAAATRVARLREQRAGELGIEAQPALGRFVARHARRHQGDGGNLPEAEHLVRDLAPVDGEADGAPHARVVEGRPAHVQPVVVDDHARSAVEVRALPEHVDEIRRRFPKHGAKVHLLRSFEAGPEPVEPAPDRDDPIGCPIDTYRECFEIIRPCIDHFLIHLRHLR